MRIANNSLKAMQDFYHKELSGHLGEAEAQALFATAAEHYLHITRAKLTLNLAQRLNQSEILQLYDCGKKLNESIPIQYILGKAWFMDLQLDVNASVLIPRPETEELCALILGENKGALSILDIGCGSGCIPIALKKNLPESDICACDISREALDLAKKNAGRYHLDIYFIQCNILDEKSASEKFREPFDVIVSNPPYILHSEKNLMEKQVLDHEPHQALFVEGEDPILFYRKIISLCQNNLKPGGRLYFELNPLSAGTVQTFAMDSGLFAKVQLINDMSGKQRFLVALRKDAEF
ncbi:MAG TPA: peptide chain release factor N(5)-glutamine methyltransferase [Bacteroidia bacterium]|nr:peptide chain release factor N(5)-glutamine methyltransferase [Bacteroidia bacterium]